MKDYVSIAEKYAPKGIRVRYKRKGNLLPAWADLESKSMLVPVPDSREGLYVFLHECAHFHLKHFMPSQSTDPRLKLAYTGNKPVMLAEQEFEAERWAMHIMRTEGVAVPRRIVKQAKSYVHSCVIAQEKHVEKIRKDVKNWALA